MKSKLALFALGATVTPLLLAAASKIPLPIEYPKYIHGGTPKPVRLANVEPARKSASPLLVPAVTVLLSRGHPVTSSDRIPVIGELSYVTDGDKTGIDGTILEIGPGPQWVQIDLGASRPIHAIAVWHYHADLRGYHDVIVQIADDPAFASPTTVFNNDQDGSSKLGRGADRVYLESNFGRLIDAKGTRGRYVRLYSSGNTTDELNHYCEVEVFGEGPATEPPPSRALLGCAPRPAPQTRAATPIPFLTKKSAGAH